MVFTSLRRWSRRHFNFDRLASQLLTLLAFLLLTYSFLAWISSSSKPSSIPPQPSRPQNALIPEQAGFWRELYTLILNNDPNCDQPPEVVVPHKFDVAFDAQHEHPRPDILWVPPSDLKRLTVAHATFLNDLKKNAPSLAYKYGTRGVVLTAGIKQLPVLVIGLRMLRRTDCELPVEVFLGSTVDYDQQICELILPALSARCVVFSDIVAASNTWISLEGYQYKVLALLFSSFEDVLLLDADAFPTRDPTSLFESKPFTETGMVLWPDFWYESASPYFFQLVQVETPSPNARPAIESGEMMFSKSKHNMTLMLSAYWNYYGPMYFYSLLSQGAPGQGDKDTFPWAATILYSNTSFYLVHQSVFALGHIDSSGVYVGSAMAQHGPVEDLERHSAAFDDTPQMNNTTPPQILDQSNATHPHPLFIHANFPKFDPSTIFHHGEQGTARPVFDSNGSAVRAWLPKELSVAYFGFDVEREFWEEVEYVACNWENIFSAWLGEKNICYNVKMYRKRVFDA